MLIFTLSLISCKNENNKIQENKQKSVKEESAEKSDRQIAFQINDRPIYKDEIGNRHIYQVIDDEVLYEVALLNGDDQDPKVIELIKRYKKNLIVGRLKGNIIRDYMQNQNKISDEDIKGYYESNKSKYTILDLKQISCPNKEIADDIYNKLKGGHDINSILSSYNGENIQISVNSIRNNKEYNKYFPELNINEISQPISERDKFNIYQIIDVETMPYKRLSRRIKYHFLNEQKIKALEEYVNKAKQEHNIKIDIVSK